MAADPPRPHGTPNIIVILADDLGIGDVACYRQGWSSFPTPHLDRLASQGMRCTDAHAPNAVCTPSRYGLLTGRYAWRTRLQQGVLHDYAPPLIEADRLTVPGLLTAQGYDTVAIGKWHLGWTWPRTASGAVDFSRPIADGPTSRGFLRFFGVDAPNFPPFAWIDQDRLPVFPSAHFEPEAQPNLLVHGSGPMAPGWRFENILPSLTERACAVIRQHAQDRQPFFLYWSLTTPHEPVAVNPPFVGASGIDPVCDLVMETDAAIGTVLATLDASGLAEDTLVIFTADNGHCRYTGADARVAKGLRPSGPHRGFKFHLAEGGHRVPFLARWPGRIPAAQVSDQTISLTGLLATCAELLAVPLPPTAGEDSWSLLDVLLGRPASAPALVHQGGRGDFALREGPWKYCPGVTEAQDTLYHLTDDPGEAVNRAASEPERVAHLRQRLVTIINDGRSTPGPAGHNEVPITWRVAPPARVAK